MGLEAAVQLSVTHYQEQFTNYSYIIWRDEGYRHFGEYGRQLQFQFTASSRRISVRAEDADLQAGSPEDDMQKTKLIGAVLFCWRRGFIKKRGARKVVLTFISTYLIGLRIGGGGGQG